MEHDKQELIDAVEDLLDMYKTAEEEAKEAGEFMVEQDSHMKVAALESIKKDIDRL